MTTRGRREVSLIVNGVAKTISAYPMERLLDVLRDEVGLTGVKEGCGEGECGACAILLDGALVNSCLVPVLQAESTQVMTIEGLSDGSQLHALQQAFLECGAAQCGICTPGMILAAHHLLNNNRNPSMEDIREGLAGNLCRCTGYVQICEAVEKVAKEAGR
jgi:aerobic carbon-monoxide dehydrogenase small subunit